MEVNRDELVEKFKQNHQRLFEHLLKEPLPLGAQIFLAGQQAEREAYEEVFGEAFRRVYDSFILQVHQIGTAALEQSREELKGTDAGNLVEEFKATFKSLLEQLKGLPTKQVMDLSTQFQCVELDISDRLIPKVQTRYKIKTLTGETGHEVTLPSNYIVAGIEGDKIVCLEPLARAVKEEEGGSKAR